MNEDSSGKVFDKLDDIYDKMECIITVITSIDIKVCSLNDRDISGFYLILRDLQDEIKEAQELLS